MILLFSLQIVQLKKILLIVFPQLRSRLVVAGVLHTINLMVAGVLHTVNLMEVGVLHMINRMEVGVLQIVILPMMDGILNRQLLGRMMAGVKAARQTPKHPKPKH